MGCLFGFGDGDSGEECGAVDKNARYPKNRKRFIFASLKASPSKCRERMHSPLLIWDILKYLLLLQCEIAERFRRKIKHLQTIKRQGDSFTTFCEATITTGRYGK
jgi:hypothetical protein